MRLAFMGTPEFSVPSLGEIVAAGHDIAAVYTREPQPGGRGHRLRFSPIQEFAEAHCLEVRTPKSFKNEETQAAFAALELDAAVVVAYGLILPQAILDAPRLGCFNLHASLLPRWRGAAPIHRAVIAGDVRTGVQVMQMEKGLDTGPILLSESAEILPDDTAGSLHDRLAQVGAGLLPRALAAIERGGVTPTPQANEGVVYAEKITPAEARIDWTRGARETDRHIRGLSPFPGAWFEMSAKSGLQRVKVLRSRLVAGAGAPGEILQADETLIVACGEGAVELLSLQRSGKSAQAPAAFLRGFPLAPGSRL